MTKPRTAHPCPESQERNQRPKTIPQHRPRTTCHGSMGPCDAIIFWLDGIIEDRPDTSFLNPSSATRQGWKRKRKRKRQPPSRLTPSPSPSETLRTMSASKRRGGDTATTDLDATPRPASRPPLTETSSTSSISQSDHDGSFASTHTGHTGRRTPIHQFQRMEVAARDPIRLRQLSVEDAELPSPLSGIVQDLSVFGKSRGVIHQAFKASAVSNCSSTGRLDTCY